MSIAADARRILVAVIAVLASTFAVVGTTAAPADAASLSYIRSISPDTFESRVIANINREREARGLRKVRAHSCTDYYAERWGRYLSRNLEFFHQDLGNVIEGCNARYAGETLAKGPIGPRGIVRAWMNSDGHRAILLSSKPSRVGIGAYSDANGYWVVAADFSRF